MDLPNTAILSARWSFRAHCSSGSVLANAVCESEGVTTVGTSEGALLAYREGTASPLELSRFETISVLLPLSPTELCVVCVEGTVSIVELKPEELVLAWKSAGPTNCLCGATYGDLVMLGSLDRRVDVLQQVKSNGSGNCLVRRQQLSVPGQVYSMAHCLLADQLLSVVAMARRWQVVTFAESNCSTLFSQRIVRSEKDPNSVLDDDEGEVGTKSLAVGVAVVPATTANTRSVALVTEDGYVTLHLIEARESRISAILTHRFHVASAVPRVGRLEGLFAIMTHGGQLLLVNPDDGVMTTVRHAFDFCVSFTSTADECGVVAVSGTEVFLIGLQHGTER